MKMIFLVWFLIILSSPSERWFCKSKVQREVVHKMFLDLFSSYNSIAIDLNDKNEKEEFIFVCVNPCFSVFEIFSHEDHVMKSTFISDLIFYMPDRRDLCGDNYEANFESICREIIKFTNNQQIDLYLYFTKDPQEDDIPFFRLENLQYSVGKTKEIFTRKLPKNFTVRHYTMELTRYLYASHLECFEEINCVEFLLGHYRLMIFITINFFEKLRKELFNEITLSDEREIAYLADKYCHGITSSRLSDQERNNLFILSMFCNLRQIYRAPMTRQAILQSKEYLYVLIKFLLNKKDFFLYLKEVLENNKERENELVRMYNESLSIYKANLKYLGLSFEIDPEIDSVSEAYHSLMKVSDGFQIENMIVDSSRLIGTLCVILMGNIEDFTALVMSEDIDLIKSIREERSQRIVSYWIDWSLRFVGFLLTREVDGNFNKNETNEFHSLKEKFLESVSTSITRDNTISLFVYEIYNSSIRNDVQRFTNK